MKCVLLVESEDVVLVESSDAHPEELERPLEEAVSVVLKVSALLEKTELEVLKLLALLEESVPAGGENEE